MDVEKISNGLELLYFTSTDSHTWLMKISQGTFLSTDYGHSLLQEILIQKVLVRTQESSNPLGKNQGPWVQVPERKISFLSTVKGLKTFRTFQKQNGFLAK